MALSNQGKYTKAEKINQETLALREKVLGKEHPVTSMASMAKRSGDYGSYGSAVRGIA